MFTGIIEELGEVVEVVDLGSAARLTARGPLVTADANHGDSIAVNGVCLTVTAASDGTFTADVMAETLHRSTLGDLKIGTPVNLERSVTLQTRLGGHLVQGHVDGTATVIDRRSDENWDVVRFDLPAEFARYVAEKGSIALDGVSLTVSAVGNDWFEVSLIPTTLALTNLGTKDVGARVNVEADVIAKYTERLLGLTTGEALAS